VVPEFWRSSGYRLVTVDAAGGLQPSDDFLRAFLLRPEVVPVEGACAAELALHEALLADPRLVIPEERLAGLADADAQHNYRLVLAFRDRLLAAPTLQRAYLDLVRAPATGIPPLFVDQLAHLILRHLLRDCADALRLRAAELLFREQKVTIHDGRIMLADEETVEMRAADPGPSSLAGLLAPGDAAPRSVDLDVLAEGSADIYWARSDRFDTVLDLSFARPGLDALCRVLETWVMHFTDAEIAIQPVQQIRDERWVWHIGLDRDASALLNDLYDGRAVDDARRARLLALFRLEFRDASVMLPRVRGRPVYLGLAMSEAGRLKLKPQNLLLNLPLARNA
jgi:hypothetical protein